MKDAHSLHSTRREKILEALFVGGVLRVLWRRGQFEAEALHSDIDASGYDVVLDVGNVTRHIQLKATTTPRSWNVNGKISDKPSGCVIVMVVDDKLDVTSWLWFGGAPGEPCADVRAGRPARHTKGDSTGHKAVRADSYKLTVSQFEKLPTLESLVDRLVGGIL